jgi:hypothetical protein
MSGASKFQFESDMCEIRLLRHLDKEKAGKGPPLFHDALIICVVFVYIPLFMCLGNGDRTKLF